MCGEAEVKKFARPAPKFLIPEREAIKSPTTAQYKIHRQTGHKMIIDRNKILKYRDIKAIRRMLEVMSGNIYGAIPRTTCRPGSRTRDDARDTQIETQVKWSRSLSRVIGFAADVFSDLRNFHISEQRN